MTAGEIGEHFPVSGATMSHHLSVLKEAGLILDDRQGKYISYELNTSVVDELIGWVSGLKGECSPISPAVIGPFFSKSRIFLLFSSDSALNVF